jgi:ERCC4-type nuclease
MMMISVLWVNGMQRIDIIDISELTLTIDTREKDAKRISTISKYFESRSAHVITEKLDTLDYRITGFYRNKEVDLGIEFKTGSDFAGNFTQLNDRFARACLEYKNVGLILHHDHSTIIDKETLNSEVTAYSYIVTNKTIVSCNYSTLQNIMRTYEREGILTGEINGLFEFPRMCIAFLNYITADSHEGIAFENGDTRNVLMKIPGIGVNGADKLIDRFGSVYNIMVAGESEIKECIGNTRGEKFIEYITRCA